MRAPVFIIGYPRSGTSFVGKLIAQFTEYRSHGESHTLTLLQELHHQINLYKRRSDFTGKELVKQLDLQALSDLNTKFFRDFYHEIYASDRFIDKTPGAVACHGWGVVKEVFPSAVFVACVRSPVEVYESALQKFGSREGIYGEVDPISLADGWVGAMRGIEKLADSIFSEDLHVVSQLELRTSPLNVVSNLFRFLDIPADAISKGVQLCSRSREDVLTDSITQPRYKTLGEAGIAEPDARKFREICSSTCERWNIVL
jgi:hypothetical protein